LAGKANAYQRLKDNNNQENVEAMEMLREFIPTTGTLRGSCARRMKSAKSINDVATAA
jgi:hypothetical protein